MDPIRTPEVVPATVLPQPGTSSAGAPRVSALATPTQIRRPGRAVIRTIVQVGIPLILGLGLVVPQIVDIILEESGENLPDSVRVVLLAAAAVMTAIAGILTRVMALPTVEAFLRSTKILSGIAAAPAVGATTDERGAVRHMHPAALIALLLVGAFIAYALLVLSLNAAL